MMTEQRELGRGQQIRAMNTYDESFHSASYTRAIEGKSGEYAIQLTDESLALCGHPDYKLSDWQWSQEAIEYLKYFV